MKNSSTGISSLKLKKDPNAKIQIKEESMNTQQKVGDEIAIIGVDCRFPKANNLDEYWANLRAGLNLVDYFPESRRKDTDPLIADQFSKYDDPYQKEGYLEEIDTFDPLFFNITPDEANKMDPSQRLFLETVWGALEDAALGASQLTGTKTGVFVGRAHMCDELYKDFIKDIDVLGWTGSMSAMLASRISYYLNLMGPALVVDTACSSSAVAVHLACQSLKTGDCEIAVAGGVNIFLLPLLDNKIGILEAPDWVLRPFDKNSSGTVWGEGVGAVILKPLAKAIEDRDHIYGVIKSSGFNNDGASNGITAPNPVAQEKLLIEVWDKANINPDTFTYFETHGTGTLLGDPIEIKALTQAFSKYTDKKNACPIGTVKSNIGHLAASAGIASLIKSLLILQNRELPVTANYSEPNPYINFAESPVYVNTELTPVGENQHIRIGINSFGISGTNCHLILDQAPTFAKDQTKANKHNVFTLSVKKEAALQDYIQKFLTFVATNPGVDIEDLCYTTNIGKSAEKFRLAVVVDTVQELQEKLTKLSNMDTIETIVEEKIFYGKHSIVAKASSAGKDGKITQEEKDALNQLAHGKIQEFITANKESANVLEEIAANYVKGADVRWTNLYDQKNVRKMSLPHYPFQKRRCWILPTVGSN